MRFLATIVLGIYSISYGFGQVMGTFTYQISIIILGLGLILFIGPAYALLEAGGDTGMEVVDEVTSE